MATVKEKVHQLVDACSNESVLEEVKSFLETAEKEDWFDELSKEDQNLLMESEAQYERNEFVTNTELLKRYEEWKKK